MRPAITWTNAAKAVFVLPLRVPVLTLLAAIAWVGRAAVSCAEVISPLLPGLDPDLEHEQAEYLRRREETIKGMMRMGDKSRL